MKHRRIWTPLRGLSQPPGEGFRQTFHQDLPGIVVSLPWLVGGLEHKFQWISQSQILFKWNMKNRYLVGGLAHEFYDFPFSWECHHPNWRSFFFKRDRYATNQMKNGLSLCPTLELHTPNSIIVIGACWVRKSRVETGCWTVQLHPGSL